jgi:hypothetical protein
MGDDSQILSKIDSQAADVPPASDHDEASSSKAALAPSAMDAERATCASGQLGIGTGKDPTSPLPKSQVAPAEVCAPKRQSLVPLGTTTTTTTTAPPTADAILKTVPKRLWSEYSKDEDFKWPAWWPELPEDDELRIAEKAIAPYLLKRTARGTLVPDANDNIVRFPKGTPKIFMKPIRLITGALGIVVEEGEQQIPVHRDSLAAELAKDPLEADLGMLSAAEKGVYHTVQGVLSGLFRAPKAVHIYGDNPQAYGLYMAIQAQALEWQQLMYGSSGPSIRGLLRYPDARKSAILASFECIFGSASEEFFLALTKLCKLVVKAQLQRTTKGQKTASTRVVRHFSDVSLMVAPTTRGYVMKNLRKRAVWEDIPRTRNTKAKKGEPTRRKTGKYVILRPGIAASERRPATATEKALITELNTFFNSGIDAQMETLMGTIDKANIRCVNNAVTQALKECYEVTRIANGQLRVRRETLMAPVRDLVVDQAAKRADANISANAPLSATERATRIKVFQNAAAAVLKESAPLQLPDLGTLQATIARAFAETYAKSAGDNLHIVVMDDVEEDDPSAASSAEAALDITD